MAIISENMWLPTSRFLSAFSYRNFSLLLASSTTSNVSRAIQGILLSWFVLEFTDSPFILGLVNAVQWIPTILGVGLIGGLVADRFDRQKIVLANKVANVVPPFLMAFLISTGLIQLWHILLIVILIGTLFPISEPANSVITLDIVGKRDLMNAVGLNMLVFQVGISIGPAVGGLLIDWMGISMCYYLSAAISGVGVIPILMIRGVEIRASTTEGGSALRNIVEGLKYIRSDIALLSVLLIAAIWNLFICPVDKIMIPVVARDVLSVGATGLGVLMAASGLGSFVGSFLIMSKEDFKRMGLLLIVSSGMLGVAVLLFAMSSHYSLSLILMFGMGFSRCLMHSTSSVLLLTLPPEEMRGRVRGVRQQVIMTLPFGVLIIGKLTELISAAFAVGVYGAIPFILSMVIIAKLVPKLRRQ